MRKAYEIEFHGKAIILADDEERAIQRFLEKREEAEFESEEIVGVKETGDTEEDWGYMPW